MIKYLIILPFIGIVYSQFFSIVPEFTYKYESDDEQYAIEELAVRNYEFIIIGNYNNKKLNILTRTGYHLIDGVRNRPSDFTHQQGLHWVEHPPGIADDQNNYYVADLKLQYGDSVSYFYLNKWDQRWGPGVNSITLSNKIPSFFHFGFKWQLLENLHFEYFHGKLKSNIEDINYSSQFTDLLGGARSFDIVRNIAGHRLKWQPFDHIIFSGTELVAYANRSIELTYLLPFVPFFPIQTYLGEMDNVIMSGDVQFIINKKIRLYGVFLMDEWSPPYTFDRDNRNWFGWQTGFEFKGIILPKSRLQIEYSWTDHRIYRHRFMVNDFYSWDYPVGFWAGPHANELYSEYNFSIGDNYFDIIFSRAKRGMLTDSLLIDQYSRPNDNPIYERFSQGVEEKQVVLLSLNRKLTQKISFNFRYTIVNWKNAGFNPKKPLLDKAFPNISKYSLGFGVQYQY